MIVSVEILDVNDNPPKFENTTYRVEILENATVGSVLTSVRAHGLDHGDNGRIRYALPAALAEKVPFEIRADTG